MQGYKFEKATGHFVEDVPFWHGEQPVDGDFGITAEVPVAGCYTHKFDEVTQTWGEGKPQAEVDQILADKAKAEVVANLSATDKDMARVGEDLLALLISKGIILMSELPQQAQDKINERAALRAQIGGST